MKHIKTLVLGIAVMVGALAPFASANAWIAAAGGWRGGAVAVGRYHPYYHPSGCYGCGAAAGAVAGLAVGAAVAGAVAAPPVIVAAPPAVVVQQPAYAVQQPAYVVQGNVPLGTQVASMPPESRRMVVNGVDYYQYGSTWYKPYYGSSGVYYEVVPAP